MEQVLGITTNLSDEYEIKQDTNELQMTSLKIFTILRNQYIYCYQSKENQLLTQEKCQVIGAKVIVTFFSCLFGYLIFIAIENKCPSKYMKNFPGLYCVDKWISPNILSFWIQLFFSSIFLYIPWFMIHLRYNSYLSYIPILTLLYMIFTHYDKNPSLDQLNPLDIGVALSILFLVIIVIQVLFTLVGYIMLKILKYSFKMHKYLGIFVVFLTCFTLLPIIKGYVHSCDNWEKGLTGEIDFSDEYCTFKKPNYGCYPTILDGLLNFSSDDQCKIKDIDNYRQELINKWFYGYYERHISQEKKQFIENNQLKALGFPNTVQYQTYDRYPENMGMRQITRTKLLQNVQEGLEQNIEVILDLEDMNMVYNIQKNEELVKQRKQMQKENSMSDNVIIIYIDALSRVQAHRKMKETLKFFEKYAIKPEMTEEQMQKVYSLGKRTFEFYRYHSIGQKTLPILFRFMYGIHHSYKKHTPVQPKKDILFKDFQNNGYIVGFSTNTCSIHCLHRVKSMVKDVNMDPPDHEYYGNVYDPTYTNPKDYFSILQGPNSIRRRCLYGHDTNYHVLNYGYEFMQTYKDEKKVLYLEFTDAHEITDEVVSYLDQNLRDFLDRLENSGHLSSKTTVYLMSDHGQHLKKSVYFTDLIRERYEQERSFPALFLMQTTDLLKNYPQIEENLKENEQKLFGIEQIRASVILNTDTIQSTLYGSEQDQIFGKMQKDKQCSDLQLVNSPNDHICQCFENKKQNQKSTY